MAKKYDNEDGVWRTIGGRRIFIKNGQDLASAMKESGKFKSASKGTAKKEDNAEKKDIVKETEKEALRKANENAQNISDEKKLEFQKLKQKYIESGKEEDYQAFLKYEKDNNMTDYTISKDYNKDSVESLQEKMKNQKANEPIEKRLEKQNRYAESEAIKEVKDKYMPERTKAVSQYQNGEIDRNELMKRFDGNEERMKETFEKMGYTAPTKENIDNANKRHEEFMNNLKNKEDSNGTDLNTFNDKAKASFGKIDYYGNGRKSNEVEIEMQLKDGVFTASGSIKNARGTDSISGGQNIDEIADMMKGNKDVQEIRDLWHKYHLNNMHAGTEKQEDALMKKFGNKNASDYDKHVEYLKSVGLYEDDGYKYGTGWLKREIPDDDKRRIISLIDKYNGKNTNTETSNKTANQSMNDTLRNAFNDYRKKHKNSNMSFTEFMRINKK